MTRLTHIGAQFQQHLDGMALSPGSRGMERGVVLLVLHIHVSSATNKAVDAVSVAWGGGGGMYTINIKMNYEHSSEEYHVHCLYCIAERFGGKLNMVVNNCLHGYQIKSVNAIFLTCIINIIW